MDQAAGVARVVGWAQREEPVSRVVGLRRVGDARGEGGVPSGEAAGQPSAQLQRGLRAAHCGERAGFSCWERCLCCGETSAAVKTSFASAEARPARRR